jgi:hypothetical protein
MEPNHRSSSSTSVGMHTAVMDILAPSHTEPTVDGECRADTSMWFPDPVSSVAA